MRGRGTDVEWVAVVSLDEPVGDIARVEFASVDQAPGEVERLVRVVRDNPCRLPPRSVLQYFRKRSVRCGDSVFGPEPDRPA